jgi:adenylate kinase family enzyme
MIVWRLQVKAIILNAAPGVGKSTLLKKLEQKLPQGFAIIDGDDVGRTIPIRLSIEWLNLMQDNIVSCAENYKKFGMEFLIISFVFPSKERLDRLLSLLGEAGIDTLSIISLVCQELELKARIQGRNTSKMISVEQALELNNQIKEMHTKFLIDTTKLKADEVANDVCNMVLHTK